MIVRLFIIRHWAVGLINNCNGHNYVTIMIRIIIVSLYLPTWAICCVLLGGLEGGESGIES